MERRFCVLSAASTRTGFSAISNVIFSTVCGVTAVAVDLSPPDWLSACQALVIDLPRALTKAAGFIGLNSGLILEVESVITIN